MTRVLVVDSGNTFRGPISEAVLNYCSHGKLLAWSEKAAVAERRLRLDSATREVLKDRLGVPQVRRNLRPRPAQYDLVVAIDSPGSEDNRDAVLRRVGAIPHVHWHISDPAKPDKRALYAAFDAIYAAAKQTFDAHGVAKIGKPGGHSPPTHDETAFRRVLDSALWFLSGEDRAAAAHFLMRTFDPGGNSMAGHASDYPWTIDRPAVIYPHAPEAGHPGTFTVMACKHDDDLCSALHEAAAVIAQTRQQVEFLLVATTRWNLTAHELHEAISGLQVEWAIMLVSPDGPEGLVASSFAR